MEESEFIRNYRERLAKGETGTDGEPSTITTKNGEALSSPVTKVDPDTVKIGDQSYRLTGFNAPETGKFQGGIFVPGQVAGDRTQELVDKVAKLGGYSNLVPTGKKDPYGRIIADVRNKTGENLGDAAVALGIVDPNIYTEDKAISDQRLTNAILRTMPELAAADPILKLALDEKKKRESELGDKPAYIPRISADNEQAYAAAKTMVGIKAVNEQLAEIDRLTNLLADNSLEPHIRVKLEKNLEDARDKLYIAGTTPEFVAGVKFRHGDRTIMNQAHDQFFQSVDNGWNNVKQGFYGMGELVGDTQKWEWLAEKGRAENMRLKQEQSDAPAILGSIRDVNQGKGTWDTTKNAATYVANLIGGTLPQMGILVAATAITAPIGGVGGAALAALPGSMLYAGQYYTEQEDGKKDASLAMLAGIGSGVLDRVGLGSMVGKNIFSEVGYKEVLATLVNKGMPEAAAKELIERSTRAELLALSEAGTEFAKRHFATKEARLAALKSFGIATVGEAGTESGQQFLEMIAKAGEWNVDVRYEKYFYEQLIDAAIGGGLMGGAMNTVESGLDMARWHSVADAQAAFKKNLEDSQLYRAEMERLKAAAQSLPVEQRPVIAATSIHEALRQVAIAEVPNEIPLSAMDGKEGMWNGFLSVVKDPVRLLRSLADTTVRTLRRGDGSLRTYLPVLKAIMAPGVLLGDHFDGFRQRIIGQWTTKSDHDLATELRTTTPEVSRMLQDAWINTWSKGGRLNMNDPQAAILQGWKDHSDAVNHQALQMLADLGVPVSATEGLDMIFEDSAIDPQVVVRNAEKIIAAIPGKERQAAEAINNLISGNPELAQSAKKWLSDQGIFRNAELAHLFEPNIFAAFENFKHRASTKAAQELYFGKDGRNLSKLLQMAAANGEFANESEYRDTVQNVKDFYAIATGTYNSLENYPFIEKVLGWGITMTMLASLGKAAISSIPEAAMSSLGTPGEKIVGQLWDAATNFFTEYKDDINKGISYSSSVIGLSYAREHPNKKIRDQAEEIIREQQALGPNPSREQMDALAKKVKKLHKKAIGRNLFEKLGYNDFGFNTQAKFETNTANMKKAMHVFSSMIGLRAQTDATRIATLSVASDIIRTRLAALQAIPPADRARRFSTGADMTNEQYQFLKELERYGMDVKATLSALETITSAPNFGEVVDQQVRTMALQDLQYHGSGSAAQILQDNFMTGLRNMIDARITNPQIANLPKYYHDPRLRIFTAMTRFIAGMTANILPRLYKDYIKDGTVGMRYQAFSVMGMAVVFAAMANVLKDTLSYGDDDNPYIKSNFKKAQRAIQGAGLLGRLDQVVEGISPLYPSKSINPAKDPIGFSWNMLKSNAPPVSWADRSVRAMYNLGTGETEKGVKGIIRSAPVVGSFPIVADTAAKMIKESE
jgi:endonuclease YncB( thermonuclease family)